MGCSMADASNDTRDARSFQYRMLEYLAAEPTYMRPVLDEQGTVGPTECFVTIHLDNKAGRPDDLVTLTFPLIEAERMIAELQAVIAQIDREFDPVDDNQD